MAAPTAALAHARLHHACLWVRDSEEQALRACMWLPSCTVQQKAVYPPPTFLGLPFNVQV